jgi:hypothetical protein
MLLLHSSEAFPHRIIIIVAKKYKKKERTDEQAGARRMRGQSLPRTYHILAAHVCCTLPTRCSPTRAWWQRTQMRLAQPCACPGAPSSRRMADGHSRRTSYVGLIILVQSFVCACRLRRPLRPPSPRA